MLLTRVITATLLAATVILATLYLPPGAFAAFIGVFAAVGAHEWAGFAGLGGHAGRGAYVGVVAVCACLLYVFPALQVPAVWLVFVVWLGAVVSVLAFPRGAVIFTRPWFTGLLGVIVIGGAWLGAVMISTEPDGRLWLVWIFFLTSLTDIGGYFVGRAVGRHPLAPRVSPAKTWEGAVGGVLLSALVCGTAVWLWQVQSVGWLTLMLGLITLAVFGDLFESVLKRATGIKDSGNILPGHGGILDRMDSVIAVLPVMALVLQL